MKNMEWMFESRAVLDGSPYFEGIFTKHRITPRNKRNRQICQHINRPPSQEMEMAANLFVIFSIFLRVIQSLKEKAIKTGLLYVASWPFLQREYFQFDIISETQTPDFEYDSRMASVCEAKGLRHTVFRNCTKRSAVPRNR